MIITGPTLRELKRSARLIGVSIHNLRTDDSTRHRLVLRRIPDDDRYSMYRADGRGGRRKVGASVCWHGHRDFMRDLLGQCPEAHIKTSYAQYHGMDHFERMHLRTRDLAEGQLCDCEDPEDSGEFVEHLSSCSEK